MQGCLGQALDAMGDFKGAAAALAVAVALQPDNHALLLKQRPARNSRSTPSAGRRRRRSPPANGSL